MPHHIILLGTKGKVTGAGRLLEKKYPGVLDPQKRVLKWIGLWGPKQYALHLMFARMEREAFGFAESKAAEMAGLLLGADHAKKLDIRDKNSDTKKTSNGEDVFGRFIPLRQDSNLGFYKTGGAIAKSAYV